MKPLRPLDVVLALLLFFATTGALLSASRTQGYTRDEGTYFVAAENHARYYEESARGLLAGKWRTFASRAVIDRWFGYNSEHPPLMKTLFGLSWRFLHRCSCPSENGLHPIVYDQPHRTLGLLSQSQSMRLPTHVLAGLLVLAVYLMGVRAWGRAAGLVGAGLTILLPRHFFHAQLACFDAPVAAMIFLVTWAYWRAQVTSSRRWRIGLGVLLGLGLATKHNTFFLPFVLLAHSLWLRRQVLRDGLAQPGAGQKLAAIGRWIFAPWVLPAALLSVAVYLALWPYLWPDPVRRFASYIGFHLHHVHYNIEYLGVNYNKPPFPWHYVPVMTLLTTPVTTLALALVGLVVVLGRKGESAQDGEAPAEAAGAPTLLVLLGALWPMLLIMRPGTPIFGAEKHWLPAMPFWALLAGAGFAQLLAAVTAGWPRLRRGGLGIVAALAVLVPAGLETRRAHPYALSHYNALAGGPQGGADLGMNRQFWGYAARGALPWLNEHVPAGAPIYFHDFNIYELQMSQKDGLARRDLFDSGMEEPGVRASDAGLVIHEKHFNKYEYWLWDAYGTTQPRHVVTHEGVPIVTVYARPPAPAPAPVPAAIPAAAAVPAAAPPVAPTAPRTAP